MPESIPNIPEVYPEIFPARFTLTPLDWALPPRIINRPDLEARIDTEIRQIRPISTMDVEFLWNETVEAARKGEADLVKNYPCGLKCPGCFSEDQIYSDIERLMTWQEVLEILKHAKQIGLFSIKFLGPGEFLQNPDALDILDALAELDIKFSIFTKGIEIAVDELTRKFHGHKGIKSGEDLAEKLSQYDNVRILQHFVSFDKDTQDKVSGSKGRTRDYTFQDGVFTRGIRNYTERRNRAVELWFKYFNNPRKSLQEGGQRLTLVATPFHPDQINEASRMYEWAAKRDMPLVIAPTMESGRGRNLKRALLGESYLDKIIELYVDIYSTAISLGVTTLEKIKEEGLSAYIGTAPCNQVANGLMMRLNGQIQMCPGPDKDSTGANYGNTHEAPIEKLWVDSPNYKMGRQMNNWCTAKTSVLPESIKLRITRRLEEEHIG